jgi:hypothetical protein
MSDDNVLLAVASAYRERRKGGDGDLPAWKAAVATFTEHEGCELNDEVKKRVSALIFEASEVYGQWLYGADERGSQWWEKTSRPSAT